MPTIRSLVFILAAVGLALVGCQRSSPVTVGVGDTAPDFTLPSANGGNVSLSKFVAKTPVLLYFNMAYG